MSNPIFDHKSVHNSTRIGNGRDGIEIKLMIYLVLVKKKVLKCVLDPKSKMELGMEISDYYYFFLCKTKLVEGRKERKKIIKK